MGKHMQLQQEERDTAQEMQAVRIRGRQLKSQLGKLEHTLELKDQLPGGLHLVDFDQLKMENESLNEKACSFAPLFLFMKTHFTLCSTVIS
jgi:histone deacetylase 6